jgi:hypothetical protein
MRALIPILLLVSCTPTIDRVERHDKSMTDSALSVLDGIVPEVDTLSIVKTRTIERVVQVESSPIISAMIRPSYIEGRGCDTVFIRDTVFISR